MSRDQATTHFRFYFKRFCTQGKTTFFYQFAMWFHYLPKQLIPCNWNGCQTTMEVRFIGMYKITLLRV